MKFFLIEECEEVGGEPEFRRFFVYLVFPCYFIEEDVYKNYLWD